MTSILIAAAVMGGMGLIFGCVLSLVGKKFAVPEDPKRDAVREALPGANCGGCGFAGCDAYAQAVADGTAPVNKCPVGGAAVAEKIGEIMGVNAGDQEKQVAIVRCRGDLTKCGTRSEYVGPMDCKSAALVADGDKSCRFSCLGLGDCAKACPFGAITVDENRLATVDESKCVGCGVCVASCPRKVLELKPVSQPVYSTCSAMAKGKVVRDACTAGCIGCGKCEKVCSFGALTMKNDLPQIDYAKCVGCMKCADACPTGAIKHDELMRKHAVIRYDKCDGCDDCKQVCKFEGIRGEKGEKHSIIEWNCTGCGECTKACTKGLISLLPGGKYKI